MQKYKNQPGFLCVSNKPLEAVEAVHSVLSAGQLHSMICPNSGMGEPAALCNISRKEEMERFMPGDGVEMIKTADLPDLRNRIDIFYKF